MVYSSLIGRGTGQGLQRPQERSMDSTNLSQHLPPESYNNGRKSRLRVSNESASVCAQTRMHTSRQGFDAGPDTAATTLAAGSAWLTRDSQTSHARACTVPFHIASPIRTHRRSLWRAFPLSARGRATAITKRNWRGTRLAGRLARNARSQLHLPGSPSCC